MEFGQALSEVMEGASMRLPHWKEDVLIKCQHPDDKSKMTHPYLYVESRHGKVPWKETFVEMFSEDWQVIK